MAKIIIIVTDKKDYPHHAFREDKMEFMLRDGFTIVDAHNVLVDLGINLGATIKKKQEDQTHAQAVYLLEEEIIDEHTDKKFHEEKLCYCFRENKQTDRGCDYIEWKEGNLTDRDIIGKKVDY